MWKTIADLMITTLAFDLDCPSLFGHHEWKKLIQANDSVHPLAIIELGRGLV